MKMNKLLILIMCLFFIIGCSGEIEDDVIGDNMMSDDVMVEQGPETHEISMRSFQWGFDPERITVREGDTVKISLTSDDVSHGFLISEFGVNKPVHADQTTEIEFVADKKGNYNYRCSVPCGSGHGQMAGLLVVE